MFFSYSCCGQRSFEFNDLDVKQISNINWKQFDFIEIKPFEKILKNHDLLILSESDHGDGASLDAECMILKGLIDSSRISVIYTESSWINLEKINSILELYGKDSIASTYKYIRSSVLAYWVANGFWDYLVDKILQRKIHLLGFDISGVSEDIVNELLKECNLLEGIKKIKEFHPKEYDRAVLYLQDFNAYGYQTYLQKNTYPEIVKFLDVVINTYSEQGQLKKMEQWQGIKHFFYWMHIRSRVLEHNKVINVINNEKQKSLFYSTRDSLMASIFLRYNNTFKNAKSVALMASYHAIKNSNKIDGVQNCCKDANVNIMGEILDKALKGKVYNIAFIAAKGFSGINYTYSHTGGHDILLPKRNSLENFLDKKQVKYAFIDLEKIVGENTSFYMAPVFGKYLKSNWAINFSGIFFIREMYPVNIKTPNILQ